MFDRCPFKYRLRYVDGLDTIPNTDADNALILGTALHTGIEEGIEQALDFYKNSFPVLTDDHIHEMMKLEAMIPKAKAMLPPGGTFELPIGNADFIGFMDYLVPVGKGLKLDGLITGEDLDEFEAFDLYDFKYSNNAKNYAVSGQLHEYKYWYELTHPGHRIRNMYFLIVPKPKIRQKSTETLSQFRDRLQAALKDAEPTLMPVQYNPMKIVDFLTDVKHMVEATDFPKNPNHFCGWCEYEEYCQKGWDYMLLPKNERRDLNATKKKVVWLYGAPFSGKTFFANQFPDPLMLNTDGNIKFVDAPYIAIRDTVTVEGRITKRKLAYEVFMDAVAELEKKQNDFRTIVVDLLEDVYESCRVYICDRQGWKHESDDSFRAWDMVRSEFLNTLKRLVNLDYENIILISHEDRSRDLTRKGGDKISSIKPNLQDKVANKVAGMVDLVARIVADDDERVLSFKTSEVIFGGGRLTVRDKEIPLTYDAFCEVYEEANQKAAGAVKRGGNTPATPAPETTDTPTTAPSRRGRKAKTATPPPLITMIRLKMQQRRLVVILMELGHRAAVKRMILFLLLNRPPVTPRLGTIFPNARTVNAFSDSTIRTRKSPFVRPLTLATVATRKAAPMVAPCGIAPRHRQRNPHPRRMLTRPAVPGRSVKNND